MPNAVGVASASTQILIYLCYNTKTHQVDSLHNVVEQQSFENLAVDVIINSIEVPKCNMTEDIEMKMRYIRSSSLPVPKLDRLYSVRRLMRTPSAYILVP